jgi:ankyrin repeat protein
VSRILPARPSLEYLKKQAKDLLQRLRQGDPTVVERFRALTSTRPPRHARLADAQRLVALDFGFASWARLKAHVESPGAAQSPAEALLAAVKENDAGRVRAALERHPDLAATLDAPLHGLAFGQTALLGAVQRGNREMIDVLLAAGAHVNARSDWWAGGFGVLDEADAALVPFLEERGAAMDAHAAARLGLLDRLERLVAANPGVVHARGGDGQTPLHFAASVAVAEYLLDRGADLDARDVDHESTPAQYMLRSRQEVARYLVARGCRTDILMAAALGDLALVRRHLDADPEVIHTSVSERYFPKRDPRSGGTIYIWTLGSHKTAHLVAQEFGHADVFRLLMERSPDALQLALACELGDQRLFDALLAARPGLARALPEGDQVRLADAAQSNNTTAVKMMLAAGWPVAVRGQHGGTPLHWAAWHGNLEMVREILRYAPPLEFRGDDHDQPPLGWALHGSRNSWLRGSGDYGATVDALLAAGATAPPLTDDLEASDAARDALRRHAGSRRSGGPGTT